MSGVIPFIDFFSDKILTSMSISGHGISCYPKAEFCSFKIINSRDSSSTWSLRPVCAPHHGPNSSLAFREGGVVCRGIQDNRKIGWRKIGPTEFFVFQSVSGMLIPIDDAIPVDVVIFRDCRVNSAVGVIDARIIDSHHIGNADIPSQPCPFDRNIRRFVPRSGRIFRRTGGKT